MRPPVRHLPVVVAAVLLSLVPAPARAATGTVGVQTCLAGRADTATSAHACAPAGARVVQLAAGHYAIEIDASAPTEMPARTACVWRSYTVVDLAGVSDWQGVTLCWNGDAWWSGGASTSCSPFLPGASCLGRHTVYQQADRNPTGWGAVAVETTYSQNCGWLFGCNDYLAMVQYGTGGYVPFAGTA